MLILNNLARKNPIWVFQNSVFIIFLLCLLEKRKIIAGKLAFKLLSKSSGKYKIVKTVGCSNSNTIEVDKLYNEAKLWIKEQFGILEFDFVGQSQTKKFINNIEQITPSGTTLLLNKIYNLIGLDKIDSQIFKLLVFA